MTRWQKVMIGLVSVAVLGWVAWQRVGWWWIPVYEVASKVETAVPLMTFSQYSTFDHPEPYLIELDNLLYIGSYHTQDPNDPELALIEAKWTEFQPTIALAESTLGLYVGTYPNTVKFFGEPAAVYEMARRHNTPIYTIDPAREDEINALRQQFSDEQLLIFFSLRSYMGQRQKTDITGAETILQRALDRNCERMVLNPCPLADVATFTARFAADFPDVADWRTLPETAAYPADEGTYLNLIAAASSQYRDEHMIQVLSDLVDKGERVLAVVGSSHVVMQEERLRTAVAIP